MLTFIGIVLAVAIVSLLGLIMWQLVIIKAHLEGLLWELEQRQMLRRHRQKMGADRAAAE